MPPNFLESDISQLKATEQALRKSEAIYKKLVEYAFDGIEIHESTPPLQAGGKWQHDLIVRNNKIYEILGAIDENIKQTSFSNKDILDMSSEYQPNGMKSSEYIRHLKDEFKDNNILNFEWQYGNESVKIDTEMSVIRFDIGDKKYITSIYKDITEKKKVEIALREREALYRHLFNRAFDGIEIYEYPASQKGKAGKLIERNEKLRKLLGRTDKELDVKGDARMLQFSPEIQSNGESSVEYLSQIQQEFRVSKQVRFDWRFIHSEGQIVDVNISTHTFQISNKRVFIGIFKDITERKKAEQIIKENLNELHQKNQELQKFIESNMQLENFAYLASHDLKEPVRTIVSFSQLLKKSADKKLSETEHEYIDFIITGAKNMSMLIEGLLSYSRVNTEDLQIQDIVVIDMLHIVRYELNSMIEQKNASIEYDNLPEIIKADKVQIRQLFHNLIINAIRYSSPEREPIVHISATENEVEWQFAVTDNGIGIKSEFYDRIFLLFRKLHNERDKGTGIGLALCKKIVENHAGNIWVESEYGKGSTFYFTIRK